MQAELELRGQRQWQVPLLCFVFGTITIISRYYSEIQFQIRIWMRVGLCIFFLAGLFFFQIGKPIWETDAAFLAVSAILLAAGLVGTSLFESFHISGQDAQWYTVSKITETMPIILIMARWTGLDLSGLHLRRGNLRRSLISGLLVGLVLFGYFLSQSGWQLFQGSNLGILLLVIGLVVIFSLFTGFMEELWVRGSFLSRFVGLLGRRWAFWTTTVLFGAINAFGSFTGVLSSLLLGVTFGYILQRTGSLWGAVLGHFFANFFFILGYFATI